MLALQLILECERKQVFLIVITYLEMRTTGSSFVYFLNREVKVCVCVCLCVICMQTQICN